MFDISPSEFWELTPREYHYKVQGYKYRRREAARDLQFLLYPHYQKHTPEISDITGFPDETKTKKKRTKEENRRDIEELKESLL